MLAPTDSKRVTQVRLYTPRFDLTTTGGDKDGRGGGRGGRRLRLHHVLFLVVYAYQARWIVSTIGAPYREFLSKAEREGFEVMEGANRLRAELEHRLEDLDDPDRPSTDKMGWGAYLDMDIDEYHERKKRERENSVLDSLPKNRRVPHRYAPSFTPCLITGVVVCLHALVALLQHWSVRFDCAWNHRPVRDASEAASLSTLSARLSPSDGPDVLVPVDRVDGLGLVFEFHRRRFVWDDASESWSKIRCRTSLPVDFLCRDWTGLDDAGRVAAARSRFGDNVFDVRQPEFAELYRRQLLSPFTVFQLFCVILWLLDDYWQYSLFNLGMILVFEGTVVFARLKSLQALRGMGNVGRRVYVYRSGAWTAMESHGLLPGDVMSLTRAKRKRTTTTDDDDAADDVGDVVPADVVLLRGAAVVNEASLTGESVPQMKEGLRDDGDGDELEMKGRHKTHVLYAGTKLLQCKGDADASVDGVTSVPPPPDGGCVCFVLRTGFLSGQGKLVRMIEGSQEKVKGHERETALLLLLLFVFACLSSGYVLYNGWNSDRSQYELLLHCILIITSVIPPELPMQMALAVNNSLMTLMKMQVFCTEPYRVPVAGKLDACLFDKTGTLTTDELVAVGVWKGGSSSSKKQQSTSSTAADEDPLVPMTKLTDHAGLVLAGCHSLVEVDGVIAGDPLEDAALSAMRWTVSGEDGVVPSPATDKRPAGVAPVVDGRPIRKLTVLLRHHFSSARQRMSCVVADDHGRRFVVVKGSPERVGAALTTKPPGYDDVARRLARRGHRVIALAAKPLRRDDDDVSAAACESGLGIFAGFVAFSCRVRRDTREVLRRIREGGMTVAMVTGDALLTAVHVAREVDICEGARDDDDDDDAATAAEKSEELRTLLRSRRRTKSTTGTRRPARPVLLLERDGDDGGVCWESYEDGSRARDFVAADVPRLAETHDLAVTGANLAAAFDHDDDVKKVLHHFKVFARMTPDAKETVIECLHSVGKLCLMCGDGANDVGALKQADVGVALLSGFGDLNVDKGEDGHVKPKKDEDSNSSGASSPTAMITRQELDALRQMPVFAIKMKIRSLGVEPDKYPDLVEKEDLVRLYRIKATEVAVKKHDRRNALAKNKSTKAEQQAKNKEAMAEKQRRIALRVQELEAQGVSFAQFKAMKEFVNEEMTAAKKKKGELARHHSVEGSAAQLAKQLDDLEMDEVPMVKLGDASIAAPFTSKMPSIRSCVDIIRQGRCTLVTSIQMYQILALNCLISAYSLSVLYLDGVKYGDVQMTAMGILMSISFMSVSRSKPLDKLSSVTPLTSIFHPSLFVSLLGQFAIHLVTMILAVRSAKDHLPEDHEVDLDGMFKPGIVNSVVFLVSNVQQVTVFVVNLQGRPFMNGLTENRPLLWSLLATFILTFMFASESVPGLNKYFQLVPFPDDAFRDYVLYILVADVFLSFALDRLMKFVFCPQILWASMEGTTGRDVFHLARTVAVILFVMNLLLGNDEQWEEMLREEGRFDEMGNGTLSDDENNNTIVETIADVAEACVGAACGDSNARQSIADEF